MFGLFRKGPKAFFEPPVIPETLQKIPVRRSAFDASHENGSVLVQEIASFMDEKYGDGGCDSDQIPPLALQSYEADCYKAAVCNGGHRKFIENCGAQYTTKTANALAGLNAMAAHEHADLLEDMLALLGEVTPYGLLDEFAEELSILDDDFLALEEHQSMDWKNAAWIRSWLILQVTEDAEYLEIFQKAAHSRPSRDMRAEMSEIGEILKKMQDPTQAMISMGLMRFEPSDMVCAIGEPGLRQYEGQEVKVAPVTTKLGGKFAVLSEDEVAIHDCDGEDIGQFEARATRFEIEGFLEIASLSNAAVALYYMLRDTGRSTKDLLISPAPDGLDEEKGMARWVVGQKYGDEVMYAEFLEKGAFFLDGLTSDEPLAMMRKGEIDERFKALTSQI